MKRATARRTAGRRTAVSRSHALCDPASSAARIKPIRAPPGQGLASASSTARRKTRVDRRVAVQHGLDLREQLSERTGSTRPRRSISVTSWCLGMAALGAFCGTLEADELP